MGLVKVSELMLFSSSTNHPQHQILSISILTNSYMFAMAATRQQTTGANQGRRPMGLSVHEQPGAHQSHLSNFRLTLNSPFSNYSVEIVSSVLSIARAIELRFAVITDV